MASHSLLIFPLSWGEESGEGMFCEHQNYTPEHTCTQVHIFTHPTLPNIMRLKKKGKKDIINDLFLSGFGTFLFIY